MLTGDDMFFDEAHPRGLTTEEDFSMSKFVSKDEMNKALNEWKKQQTKKEK